MTELIEKVKEAKKVLDNSQKELLNWCRDTSAATLDQRFDVWSKYVEKDESPYIGIDGSKILGELVDMWVDGRDIDRHQTVSYGWVLDSLCDWYASDTVDKYNKVSKRSLILDVLNKHKQLVRDKRIDSVLISTTTETKTEEVGTWLGMAVLTQDEFESFLKEEIMIANFGSFEFDW